MNSDSDQVRHRQRNQKGEGGRLKQELLEAAMRILDRSPAKELSLRMIAREAGVAAPSIYAHFDDALDLNTEIVRDCWRQLAAEMARVVREDGIGDAKGALRAQLGAYVRYAMERPSRYQLLFAMQPIHTEEQDDLPALLQPVFRMVRDTLRSLRDQGYTLPESSSFAATLMIISLVHGRIALAHLAPGREGNSAGGVETFMDETLDRLFPHPGQGA